MARGLCQRVQGSHAGARPTRTAPKARTTGPRSTDPPAAEAVTVLNTRLEATATATAVKATSMDSASRLSICIDDSVIASTSVRPDAAASASTPPAPSTSFAHALKSRTRA